MQSSWDQGVIYSRHCSEKIRWNKLNIQREDFGSARNTVGRGVQSLHQPPGKKVFYGVINTPSWFIPWFLYRNLEKKYKDLFWNLSLVLAKGPGRVSNERSSYISSWDRTVVLVNQWASHDGDAWWSGSMESRALGSGSSLTISFTFWPLWSRGNNLP